MKSRKPAPPNQNEWQRLPIDVKLYVVLRIFIAVIYPQLEKAVTTIFRRVDIWLFPPAAFFSTYNLAIQNIPDHPIKTVVVFGTATMCASWVMLVIRPRRRLHWVNSHE